MVNIRHIKPVVCIPVYKIGLNKYEEISLKRHLSILSSHDRYILLPKGKVAKIVNMMKKLNIDSAQYKLHVVEDKHLDSVYSYNQLMLSLSFYKFYKHYTHILIAQLDAYTFSDQLLEWCMKSYEYIGAPIYRFDKYWTDNLIACGLGGFSLRCINSFIDILKINPKIFRLIDFIELTKRYSFKGRIFLLGKYFMLNLKNKTKLESRSNLLLKYLGINEDICYCVYLPKYKNNFKVAGYESSMSFCIDWNVKKQLKSSISLPFGAHAWWTYPENLKQWSSYIVELNE